MSEVNEKLKSLLIHLPPLDFSQDQLLIRLPLVKNNYGNFWIWLPLACLLYDPLRKIFNGDLANPSLSWMLSIILIIVLIELGIKLMNFMVDTYEINIRDRKVHFSTKKSRREVAGWECHLADYEALSFKHCPESKIFSVNLVHPNPERALPIVASLNEAVARGQFEELNRYLQLPKVDLVDSQSQSIQSQDQIGFGPFPVIFILGMFLMGTSVLWLKWDSIEWLYRWLFGGMLGGVVVMGLLLFGSGRPYGVTKLEEIQLKKIVEEGLKNKIKKRYQRRITEVQELGFQELCCYREELPNFSALIGFLEYILMLINRELTQVKPVFRLTTLLPLFALPGRSTYVAMTAKGTSFFTKFSDGSVVDTSTHQKLARFNWFDQEGQFARYSTGASISETWAQHQKRLEHMRAEGKVEGQSCGFDEYKHIVAQLYDATLKNNWFS